MAFENLFVRTQKSIGGIQLDAVISESHVNEVSLTSNPVELGADITDHAVLQPKKLNIVAMVSDTPLGLAAFGQIVDLITGLFGTSTGENLTRSNTAYNAMVQLQETREPLEIQTKLKLYTNMIITSIKVVQDKNTSRVVSMNIDLQEVLITQTELVQLSEKQLKEGSPRDQASSPAKEGRKSTQEISEEGPTKTTNKSVLKSVIGWVSG